MSTPGAPPKFKEAHINWVFWNIANNQPMGRKMLVEKTNLGEGSLRTILQRLEEYGLVRSARPGRTLSEDGNKVFQKMRQLMHIEKAAYMDMTGKPSNCVVLVKGCGEKVHSGMEQRDAAIQIGRNGATTIVVKKGKFIMPGFEKGVDIDKQYPQDASKIRRLLDPEEGDALIIGSEETPQAAEEAAWVAASTLFE